MPIVPIHSSPTDADTDDVANPNRRLPPVRHRVRQAAPAETKLVSDDPPALPSPAYSVGYGRPPVQTRFKPGTSGNPKGRPKYARGLNTMAREMLTERVPVRTASGEKRMHRIEAVLLKTFELALKGNHRALSNVLSLYASAVPEKPAFESVSLAEDLTMTDLAILEEFKASHRQEVPE